MQSEQINELAAALAKAQAEFTHASKAVKNEYFKSSYADLPAVIDASRAALSKNGLCVMQSTTVRESGDILLVTTLAHSGGQWIKGEYPVKPVKADPQGYGSALTYARRYAYCAIVGVAAIGEDDDGNAASGNHQSNVGIFKTAIARKTYVQNVLDSIALCETVDDLSNVWTVNAKKVKEMTDSGNEHDGLGADELVKMKDLKKASLLNIQLDNEFKERV